MIGIIINNIGSPSEPTPESVGIYLREFLMDKYVIDIPFPLRWFLVNCLIVPKRKFESAKKYKSIWGQKKSPLIELTESFVEKCQKHLGEDFHVIIGNRYQSPSVAEALEELTKKANEKNSNLSKIMYAPMYPQWAQATTGSANEDLQRQLKKLKMNIPVMYLEPFYHKPFFLNSVVKLVKRDWETKKWDHILFSYHGLPVSQLKKDKICYSSDSCCQREDSCQRNCYRAQCLKTSEILAGILNLKSDEYSTGFQSRLGKDRWIEPSTSWTVQNLAKKGIKNLLIQAPSFTFDCIETLEEVAMELRDEFLHAGGEKYQMIPCPNDLDGWVHDFVNHIRDSRAKERF